MTSHNVKQPPSRQRRTAWPVLAILLGWTLAGSMLANPLPATVPGAERPQS